jgi:3-hydroxyacyl-[acyl-carrier-protein] dehydratase
VDREQIKEIIPHREPMLLIDSARLTGENRAESFYHVRGDEWFLQGHFPGKPVVPGVILCEIMAQSCCVILADIAKGKTPYFTGLEKTRFKNPVLPGDEIKTKCELLNVKEPFYFAKAGAYVRGRLCACAEFSFALIDGANNKA